MALATPGVILAASGENPFVKQLQKDVSPNLSAEIKFADETANPALYVIRWVRVALSLLGIATVAGIAYGGFLWMTAGGGSDQVDKAKKLLRNMIIGLVIILSGYSIAWYATIKIQYSTGATGGANVIGGSGGFGVGIN